MCVVYILNPLITTRIFVDRMTSTTLSTVDQTRTFRYVCLYVCTYLLLCVLQHLSVCVCLTVCSPDVIFIHLVCPQDACTDLVYQNILDSVEVVQQVGDSDKYTPELEQEPTVENTQEGIQCEGDSCDNTSTTPAFKLPKKYTPPQAKWAPPKEPTNLVDRLVSMGFPNRHLNEELLKKHNNHIRAVVNDLLDRQS